MLESSCRNIISLFSGVCVGLSGTKAAPVFITAKMVTTAQMDLLKYNGTSTPAVSPKVPTRCAARFYDATSSSL
jgi:hypothetical protein